MKLFRAMVTADHEYETLLTIYYVQTGLHYVTDDGILGPKVH